MISVFKTALSAIVLAITITGCATTSTQQAKNESNSKNSETPSPERAVEQLIQPEPPKLELDAELLEQLMVTNFASYGADWSRAMQSALSAAQTSNDFRIARLAAVLALRTKSYDSAAKAATLWFELEPENPNALNALMIALVGSGDVVSALQQLREIEDDRNDIDTHIRETAGILVRQPNADAAIEIVTDYVNRYADSAQVLLSTAYVAEYFKRHETAEFWLSNALELKPNWDLAAQMKVNMLRRQDKQQERVAYIDQYVLSNPKSVPMRINQAAELARQEKYSEAFVVMQQVIEDDPKNVSALTYTAALAEQLGQQDVAVDLYQTVLKYDINNDEVRWTLARYAIEKEQFLKAERLYQQIQSKENYFRAQLQVANMRHRTRNLKSAINVLRALEPETEAEYVDVAITRHYLLMQESQYDEAFAYINETLIYLPNNDELVYARGLVAAELGELEVVEGDLRAIIQRQPDHANALNALGYTLADQTERYAEAKALIVQALQLRPKDAHILDSMGWVLYRLEDYDGAIEYLQQAYDDSAEVEIAAHLGEVLWEAGDRDKANQVWQEALAKDSDNQVLNETLQRYKKLEPVTDQIESNHLLEPVHEEAKEQVTNNKIQRNPS